MTKRLILILLLISIAACDDGDGELIPQGYQCGYDNEASDGGCKDSSKAFKKVETCAKPEIISKFVVDCAKAANPLSDEEGEDLVAECRITGFTIFCETETVYFKK